MLLSVSLPHWILLLSDLLHGTFFFGVHVAPLCLWFPGFHAAHTSLFLSHLIPTLSSTIPDPLMNSKSRPFLNSRFIHLFVYLSKWNIHLDVSYASVVSYGPFPQICFLISNSCFSEGHNQPLAVKAWSLGAILASFLCVTHTIGPEVSPLHHHCHHLPPRLLQQAR